MKLYRYLNFLLTFFLLVFSLIAQSQDVRVEIGDTELSAGQLFEVKVFVRNSQDRSVVVFPDLPGLEKAGTTRVRSTASAAEKQEPLEVVVQQYSFSGEFLEVPASEVTVDGKVYSIAGFTLHSVSRELADSLEGAFDRGARELDDILSKEDVFLTVRPNKKTVYLREGFGVYLSMFVAKDVALSMEFYDFDSQLTEIIKLLKPDGCWEENTWIDEIVPRAVTIRDRDYTEYRLYQSIFFPFIQKNVVFPGVSLKMKMGEGAQPIRTFYSRPVSVEVRGLPPHPRRDEVAVGQYRLTENLLTEKIGVGQPFRYGFSVSGEGNIAAIPAPTTIPVQTFEFYPPEVTHTLRTDLSAVTGTKSFEYTLVAKQKGVFPLKGYFQWIFFDPVRSVYDTLHSVKTIEVSGTGVGTVAESVAPIGENRLYANLEQLNSATTHRNYTGFFRILMNVVVILMLAAAAWVFRK